MQSGSHETPHSTEARFAETLASFLKNCFVYPENNVRVQDALTVCFELLEKLSHREELTAVKIAGPHVLSAGIRLEPPHTPLLEWMRQTFQSTALAGIEFGRNVTRGTLIELARRLRGNFTVRIRRPSFDTLWSEPVEQLRFIEPRYHGRFTAKDEGDHDDFPDAEITTTGRYGQSIHKHPGIASRLSALEEILSSREGAALREVDVVSHIVNLLPDNIRENPVALIKTVETVLLHATDELKAKGDDYSSVDFDYRKLLLRICRTFFVHEAEKEKSQCEVKEGIQGHAGDELFTDDLEAFLQELAQLPEASARFVLADSNSEQLGVCLHQLVTCDNEDHLGNIEPRVRDLLAQTDGEMLGVVRQCIAVVTDSSHREERGARRLLELLREDDYSHVLRSVLVLPPEFVIRSFPAQFCLFLDSLDAEDAGAEERLDQVVEALGRTTILAKAATLIADGILEPGRVAALLDTVKPERLPFAELILQHGKMEQRSTIVHYLRKFDLKEPAAGALCIPEHRLPEPYLLAMCQEDKRTDSGTVKVATHLLRTFLESPVHNDEIVSRQVFAVHALQRLWSGEVAAFLQTMSRRGFGLRARAAKPVREAARVALRRMNH